MTALTRMKMLEEPVHLVRVCVCVGAGSLVLYWFGLFFCSPTDIFYFILIHFFVHTFVVVC